MKYSLLSVPVIVEGIAATLLMTLFVRLLNNKLQVVKILGTMLAGRTTDNKGLSGSMESLLVGTIGHYLIGIGFSLVYHLLWLRGITSPTLSYCLLLGFISGILAVIAWKSFVKLHPDPPLLPGSFYPIIFTGHIVFGAGIFLMHLIIHS
jgi:hypothetical protein